VEGKEGKTESEISKGIEATSKGNSARSVLLSFTAKKMQQIDVMEVSLPRPCAVKRERESTSFYLMQCANCEFIFGALKSERLHSVHSN
jgi:hypothetical protein